MLSAQSSSLLRARPRLLQCRRMGSVASAPADALSVVKAEAATVAAGAVEMRRVRGAGASIDAEPIGRP